VGEPDEDQTLVSPHLVEQWTFANINECDLNGTNGAATTASLGAAMLAKLFWGNQKRSSRVVPMDHGYVPWQH